MGGAKSEPNSKEGVMREERPDQRDPEPERPVQDESQLDDLDPEEQGEDVKGGGARQTSQSTNY
jgi:hypothetical protein